MKLTDTQRVILSTAAQHEMGLACAPKTLPAAARNAVFRSLIKTNLLTEINAPQAYVGLGWRQDEDGNWILARITDEGLRAIGIDPNKGDAAQEDAQSAAAIAQICEATGWQQHTVGGFFAGLKKRQGIAVQMLERVRQVGPNKEGARGSYTVYHLPV